MLFLKFEFAGAKLADQFYGLLVMAELASCQCCLPYRSHNIYRVKIKGKNHVDSSEFLGEMVMCICVKLIHNNNPMHIYSEPGPIYFNGTYSLHNIAASVQNDISLYWLNSTQAINEISLLPLQTIKPADIATVRKLAKPPHLIMRIMDCCLLLFQKKVDTVTMDPERPCVKPSWSESLKVNNIFMWF